MNLKRINNKLNSSGFTTVEIVVSFALIVIILASLSSIVINYREKVNNEIIKTQLLDFKNTITKIVYDDITAGEYVSLTNCSNNNSCISFKRSDDSEEKLEIITQETSLEDLKKGIYFQYKGIKYFLPDSDLNNYSLNDSSKYAIDVKDIVFNSDATNNLYSVKILIFHRIINEEFDIKLVIS